MMLSAETPISASRRSIRDTLANDELVPDHVFDEIYPRWARQKSSTHWTRVQIAVRAATLLAERPGARLLDIGSGVGKFCIIAAAAVGARVCGIEHRPHLVDIARAAAARIGVDAEFRRGTLVECVPEDIDGIYIYNPFTENVCDVDDRIDSTVELSMERYLRDVAATESLLAAARVGTRVVTYYGFGGDMPDGYERVAAEVHGGLLELWIKRKRSPPRSRSPGAEGQSLFASVPSSVSRARPLVSAWRGRSSTGSVSRRRARRCIGRPGSR